MIVSSTCKSVMLAIGLSISCILLTSSLPSQTLHGAQNKKWGVVSIDDASAYWTIVKHEKTILATNAKSKQSFTVFQDTSEAATGDGESYEIISLVGPVLTVKFHWNSEGGAHPSSGSYFKVVNLADNNHALSITDLFNEELVLKALLSDTIVRKALGNNQPKSLAELVQTADGGCDMSFFNLPESFAFHHVKENSVAVRFGLKHGCEAMRGNFTQIGVYLTIPEAASELFKAAEKNQTVMQHRRRLRK